MSKYYKPVYEFLTFSNPMTVGEIASILTQLRAENVSFRVVSFSHTTSGMTVLIVRDVLTEIEPKKDEA